MQNDERDDREVRDDQQEHDPAEVRDDAEGPLTEPPRDIEPPRDDEAEEFETPSWPQQDTAREEPQPAAEPVVEAAPDWPAQPEPPPPDVEAYAAPPSATEPAMPAHSVPATEPGESTRCPRCGTENRPGIAFCRNCGQRLVAASAPTTVARPEPPEGTQACPRCGTHNRAGVAFCQNCGANLRGAAEGYVPPAVAPAEGPLAAEGAATTGRAVLGPVVLLIGAVGIATAWFLPFLIGSAALYDQAFGGSSGYGVAFWSAYNEIETLAERAYFGFAAPAPLLVGLLAVLAIAGFVRRAPGLLQLIGLVLALVWAIGLVVLFFVVEVFGGPGGGILDILRALSPGGIIFMLASLIVVIGALTRIGRG